MSNVKRVGFVGLGRMGQAFVLNLLKKGFDVVAYNRTREKTEQLISEFRIQNSEFSKKKHGNLKLNVKRQMLALREIEESNVKTTGNLYGVFSVKELVEKLDKPRIIMIMVSHGKPVDDVIESLLKDGLGKGDIVCDCGNSFFKDSVRRYQKLKKYGIYFLDIGTSGGIEGARNGACMMVGGDREIYEKVEPILKKVTVGNGLTYFGEAGTGHFVKMIHNGVEYGMLQAIGEGFDILKNSKYHIDLYNTARNWSNGSVVRGWLMDLLQSALQKDSQLEGIEGKIGGGSTGEWTVQTAEDLQVEAPVIRASLDARKKSLVKPTFAGKIVSALRREFGGHRT